MEKLIKVRSASDCTVVINAPEIPLVKTWTKRGATYPIDRDKLIQAYYSTSLESLMRKGVLIIDDKDFLVEVGFIDSVEEVGPVIELTEKLMKRCIGPMPISELKSTLECLSEYQISELAEYAILHFTELNMDRIDLLSAVSHKNILKAIELHKAAQED